MNISPLKLFSFLLGLLFSFNTFAEDHAFNLKYGVGATGFGFGPEAEFKINDQVTALLAYESVKVSGNNTEVSTQGLGVAGRYYFEESLTQSDFVHLGFASGSADVTEQRGSSLSSEEYTGDGLATTWNLFYGKVWMWENFNLEAAAGLRHLNFDNILLESDSGSTVEYEDMSATTVGLKLHMGYAF